MHLIKKKHDGNLIPWFYCPINAPGVWKIKLWRIADKLAPLKTAIIKRYKEAKMFQKHISKQ